MVSIEENLVKPLFTWVCMGRMKEAKRIMDTGQK